MKINVGKYLKNPAMCPFCSSSNVESSGAEPSSLTGLVDRVTCNSCDGVWNDIYTLSEVEVAEQPSRGMEIKKKFKVFVTWQMAHEVEVEAWNIEEAISRVENDEIDINVDNDGTYIDGSFEVNTELTEDFNEVEEFDLKEAISRVESNSLFKKDTDI